jgi:ATP-binding cassette, subfamily A (ABC1), member 3
MSHSARQFRALTKKNFLLHFRQPGCAIAQLLCPALVMLLLVWIRTKITTSPAKYSNLDVFKTPFFPTFEYLGANRWDTKNLLTPYSRQQAFLAYDNYTMASLSTSTSSLNFTYNASTGDFNISANPTNPLAFLPTHCLA